MEEEIFKKMYLHLFNAVTDVLSCTDLSPEAEQMLIKAQQDCEQMYIEAEK